MDSLCNWDMIDVQYTYNKIDLQVYYQANPSFKLETNDGQKHNDTCIVN